MENSRQKVSIVIPTYNEQDNIAILLERLFHVLHVNNIEGEVIIVDDDSKDATRDEVERYSAVLIRRHNEKGLASACAQGFKAVRSNIIVVMDADLQHPPEKIPALIDAIKKGADIAVASRYVSGGSVGEFDFKRKMASRLAGALADLFFLEVRSIKDKGSGFFAFRKDVIEGIALRPKGYKILLEILIRGRYKEVREIGYVFGKRRAGKSKLGFSVIFSYIYQLISLRYYRRFI